MSDPAFIWLFCIYYLANQFEFAATHWLIILTAHSLKSTRRHHAWPVLRKSSLNLYLIHTHRLALSNVLSKPDLNATTTKTIPRVRLKSFQRNILIFVSSAIFAYSRSWPWTLLQVEVVRGCPPATTFACWCRWSMPRPQNPNRPWLLTKLVFRAFFVEDCNIFDLTSTLFLTLFSQLQTPTTGCCTLLRLDSVDCAWNKYMQFLS